MTAGWRSAAGATTSRRSRGARRRLPLELFDEVFPFVLRLAAAKQLLSGQTVGVDSTTLEASAAMKSIVRRDTGDQWREYVARLMKEEGAIAADAEPTDEDARIIKRKDGRTHLGYKAEHVVDLASEIVVAAAVYPGDQGDSQTLVDSVREAQENLRQATGEAPIEEVAADKGYHAAETLELADGLALRTYIPEPARPHARRWTDKPPKLKAAVDANRRRTKRAKSKKLQRLRSERVERSFAHVCDSGGMRRSWLRGLAEVAKRYRLAVAAHNLAIVMRKLFKIGKPRALQGLAAIIALVQRLIAMTNRLCDARRFTVPTSFPRPAPAA